MTQSEPFRIPRVVLARLSAEEYVRSFWWVIAGVPLFGLISMTFGTTPFMRAFGALCVAWPLTIPLRALFITSKTGRMFARGTRVSLDDEALYFHGDEGQGLKLRWDSVRQVEVRHGYYILRTRRVGFVPIPIAALAEGDLRTAFEQRRAKL